MKTNNCINVISLKSMSTFVHVLHMHKHRMGLPAWLNNLMSHQTYKSSLWIDELEVYHLDPPWGPSTPPSEKEGKKNMNRSAAGYILLQFLYSLHSCAECISKPF